MLKPVEVAKSTVAVMCDAAALSTGTVQDIVRRKARRIGVARVFSLDKGSR